MLLDDMLLRTLRHFGTVDAICERERSVSYQALSALVSTWAGRLAGLGVERGDRVSIVSHNRVDYAALYFAIARVGAVAVAHNWRLLPTELVEQIAHAEAVVVVADAEAAAQLDPARADARGVRTWIDLDAQTGGWAAPGALAEVEPEPRRADEDEVVVQMYTSGTTGRSKGAMLTHRNLTHMVLAWSVEMPLHGGQTRFLQVTPLFHVGGLVMVLLNAAHGATLLLEPDFQPGPAVRRLQGDRATHALFVPAMIQWMLMDPAMRGATFPELTTILYGASPFPVDPLRRAMAAFDCGFLHAYGLTETAGVVTALSPAEHVYALDQEPELLESAGRAMLGCATRIVTPEGQALPDGSIGEILVRGPNVFAGYWRNAEETARALRDGWLWTGDIGRMDARGYVTILDRSKDMIIVGGENVYPSEVEAVIRQVDGVLHTAVIGIPHKVWGESVLALIVAAPDAEDPDELPQAAIDACRARLARFKCPSRAELADEFPRTPAGKVQKAVLRAPYWEGRTRAI